MNRIGSFVLSMLLIGLFLNVALADTPEFISKLPTNNPTSDQGETQGFSVNTNQTMDFVWLINSIQDGTTSSDNTSSYSNNTAPVGDYNVTVVATNGNETISTNWTWTVNTPPAPNITSSDPSDSTVSSYNGSLQTFSINTNQTVDITWYRESVQVASGTGTSSSYSNTSTPGTYNITVSIENPNGTDSKIWTWSVISIPPPSITRDPTSNPDSNLGQDQEFTVTIDQPVNITWLMNGTEIHNESLKTSSTYSNSSMPIGTYNITVNIENVNGTNTTTWMWSVVPISVVISDPIPSTSTPSTVVDETITFSIEIDQSCKVEWYVGDDLEQTNSTLVTFASFTTSKGSSGTYTVKAIATNTTTSAWDSYTWTWKVNPKTFYSGNRIWVEDSGMSDTYTWNPQSFSGFYYDLDNDIWGETLTIEDIDGSLGKYDIIYETSPISIDFEHDIWGTYQVIGFMADRYFAGYTSSTTFASSSDSLLDEKQLSKVLLDTDKKYNLRSGNSLELEEEYELRIAEFGSGGDAVMVAMFKNGEKVAEDIVKEGDTFVYEKDMRGARDMPIIAMYFDNVFVGTETSTIVIEGIFQVSDNYIDVSTGDEFGLMEIKSVSSSGGITMKNDNSVSLGEGDDFNLMGKINIIVADHSTLRFAPYVDMSEPGTYELRGTVVTEETEFDWTPFNFEGLLYDIDTGDGDETLHIERSGRTVNANKLTYTTKPISMKFEHSGDNWNDFQSIGFMGDIYFAGYESNSFVSSDRSLIKEGKLSKILIDEDKKHSLHIGNSLTLEEGYSLRIDEISRDGGALMLALLKDGEVISTDIASEGDTYLYEIDVGGTDIPIIVAHIDSVFRGMETNSVFIDGIFQISDSFTTVEKGDSYGIMEITSTSPSIVLKNEDSFSLDRDDTINIMGEIKFKVADSGTVRFYPFQEIIVDEPLYLDLDIPDSVYQNEELTISVTSDGDEVEDVSIFFDDSEIGTTDSNGELIYSPLETGEFKVTASKSGYESDSKDIEILYQPKVLEISAPLLADKNETIVISVTCEGKSVSGVTIMFGSNDLGTTPASGNITHTPDQIGTHTITASKSGYQDASKDIDITDPSARLVYSNLTIEPKSVQPGENVNITVEAANFGTLREADTMTLKVNGEEVVTEDLVLGPGEIMTIEFTMNRSKPGTYLVEVDGRSDTFKVIGSQISSTAIVVLAILAILSITAIIYSFAQGTLSFDIIIGKAQAFEQSLRRLIGK
jgi:S-layer protein (TIGR01567 family)